VLGILKQDVETTNRVSGMFFHRIERIGLVLQVVKECMKSLHLYIQIIRTHYSAIIQFNIYYVSFYMPNPTLVLSGTTSTIQSLGVHLETWTPLLICSIIDAAT
jgi:hypothetical protein